MLRPVGSTVRPAAEIHRLAGPQPIGVEADRRDAIGLAAADLSGRGPAIAQGQGHGAVGLARHDVDRRLHLAALIFQPHHVLALTPSFSAVAGLIRAALSQVSRVIGSGNSCSQPLLANRPS